LVTTMPCIRHDVWKTLSQIGALHSRRSFTIATQSCPQSGRSRKPGDDLHGLLETLSHIPRRSRTKLSVKTRRASY
jgi:hypothetical protein